MTAADRDREAFEAAWKEHESLMEQIEHFADRADFGAGWDAALTHARAQAGEPVAWAKAALDTLAAYEADLGEPLPDDHEIGRIDESRDSPSFRIRVGHIRQLATHPTAPKPAEVKIRDTRPANCRFRLEEEGKPHPKSGCDVAGCRGVFGAICRSRSPAPEAEEFRRGAEATKASILKTYDVYLSAAEKSPFWDEAARQTARDIREFLGAICLPLTSGEG